MPVHDKNAIVDNILFISTCYYFLLVTRKVFFNTTQISGCTPVHEFTETKIYAIVDNILFISTCYYFLLVTRKVFFDTLRENPAAWVCMNSQRQKCYHRRYAIYLDINLLLLFTNY